MTLYYTKDHEWLRVEGDTATVGISNHAQEALGDIVFAEVPDSGKQLKKGDDAAVVESVKAASDIYAPAKGTVVEVNKALESNPALINTDPYGEGWIYLLQVENADQLKALKDAPAYRSSIG